MTVDNETGFSQVNGGSDSSFLKALTLPYRVFGFVAYFKESYELYLWGLWGHSRVKMLK